MELRRSCASLSGDDKRATLAHQPQTSNLPAGAAVQECYGRPAQAEALHE